MVAGEVDLQMRDAMPSVGLRVCRQPTPVNTYYLLLVVVFPPSSSSPVRACAVKCLLFLFVTWLASHICDENVFRFEALPILAAM